jgi:hypothetical protein
MSAFHMAILSFIMNEANERAIETVKLLVVYGGDLL